MKHNFIKKYLARKNRVGIFVVGFLSLVTIVLSGGIYAANITSPVELTYAPPLSHVTMQTFAESDCASMGTYTTLILEDERDSKQYRIRKMPDSRCWMVDNLALSTNAQISIYDTDIDTDAGGDFVARWNTLYTNGNPAQDGATRRSNGTCTSHSSSLTPTTTGAYLTCDGATYADTNDGYIAYSDPLLGANQAHYNCVSRNGVNVDSLTGCGYLYNWYTATAGSGNFGTITDTNVSSSICPAGWNLPKGEAVPSQNEFSILNSAMADGVITNSTTNSTATRLNWRANGAYEGSLSGRYESGFVGAGYSGGYWSSSAYSSALDAYYLGFNDSTIDPGNGNISRASGMAVRCVL